ncbi:hypothetical protein JCM10450v2_002793 [Rhodotorula kratochvilovae]
MAHPAPHEYGMQGGLPSLPSTIDPRAVVPSEETRAWLYSLPLPPGCTVQPEPQTSKDWVLVEQYRLLCQALAIGRLNHQYAPPPPSEAAFPPPHPHHGHDSSTAHAANAAYLGALSAVEAGLGGSAAGVLRHRGSSPSPSSSSFASSRAHPASSSTTTTTLDYGTSIRLDPATGDVIASLPLSLADLASLPSHALDPSQIPADGVLADHLPLDLSGPASLPSLMGAIAELEQCVARLSLEASEARSLQKTLRQEMAARTGAPGTSAGAGRKKKKKAKKGKKGGAAAAAAALELASAPAATTADAHAVHHLAPAPAMTRDEALVSGLSGRVDDCCSECGESHAALPPHHGGAVGEGGGDGEGGLGVRAWEDGELMKALQSVSMLDRRADEYRERLRVLKEQIHHHAALADALSPSAAAGEAGVEGLWPADEEGEIYEIDEEEEEEEELDEEGLQRERERAGPFGSSASDAGFHLVSVDEHRRGLAA